MAEQSRVWIDGDYAVQHFAVPPGDETEHEWAGTTACGIDATLRWVPPEQVDTPTACPACVAVVGFTPPLEGDDPGPV